MRCESHSTKHIHTLTGLRGLAALIVFVSHSANESILPATLGDGFGQTGVMLFFVLSGFLMAHLYIHEEFNSRNLKRYIFARIGRVFPLYYTLLISSVVITQFISTDSFFPFRFEVGEAIRALLLIDAKYLFWTIPVEVQFYVVFVGFWALYKKGVNIYWLSVIIIVMMLPKIIVALLSSKFPSVFFFAFFVGSISALMLEKIKHNATVRIISDNFGFLVLALLFINLPGLRGQYGLVFGNDFFLRTWGDPVTWCIVYAVFICAALNSKSLSILNSKLTVYLGNVSYGFYLIHYPVLLFFVKETSFSSYAKFLLAFLVTLALSHISFYYFEKPAGKAIRAIGNSSNKGS